MPRVRAAPAPLEVVTPLAPPSPFAGTILDAMDIAGLTGPSWAAWRVFLKAVFALPMDEEEFALYRKHSGRTTRPTKQVREAWEIIGARGGKSTMAGIVGAWLAIRRDYTPLLGRGERAVIPIIAADKKQAEQVLNALKGFVLESAILPYVATKNDKPRILATSVEFITGVTVRVATASFRTNRGYTIPAILADEIAVWRSDDAAEPDKEILNALRRGTMTMPEPLLLVFSTPYARKGELYRAFKEWWGQESDRLVVWNADSLTMHPDPNNAEFIASEFERDPMFAASEYGRDGFVQFRADVETFVDPEALEAVIVAGRKELAPQRDENGNLEVRYVAFTDPSGGSQDSWTLAISHLEGQRIVLDAVREVQPSFSPADVVNQYAILLRSYGIIEIWGDHYAGEFPRELFRQQGIRYRTSEAPKSDLYREWLPLLNTAQIELLDLPRLRAQFCGLDRQSARSGKESIDHAPGGHDDVSNAVAGSMVRAARYRPSAPPKSLTRPSPWVVR